MQENTKCQYLDSGFCYKEGSKYVNGCVGLVSCDYYDLASISSKGKECEYTGYTGLCYRRDSIYKQCVEIQNCKYMNGDK